MLILILVERFLIGIMGYIQIDNTIIVIPAILINRVIEIFSLPEENRKWTTHRTIDPTIKVNHPYLTGWALIKSMQGTGIAIILMNLKKIAINKRQRKQERDSLSSRFLKTKTRIQTSRNRSKKGKIGQDLWRLRWLLWKKILPLTVNMNTIRPKMEFLSEIKNSRSQLLILRHRRKLPLWRYAQT